MTEFENDVYLRHSSNDKSATWNLAERPCEHRTLNIQRRTLNDASLRCSAFDVGCSMFKPVLVMSQAAFDSEWVTLARHTALFRDPANQQRRFIPLRLDTPI